MNNLNKLKIYALALISVFIISACTDNGSEPNDTDNPMSGTKWLMHTSNAQGERYYYIIFETATECKFYYPQNTDESEQTPDLWITTRYDYKDETITFTVTHGLSSGQVFTAVVEDNVMMLSWNTETIEIYYKQ